MGKEVDMKDPESNTTVKSTESTPEHAVKDKLLVNVKLIEKAVRQKETRAFFGKVLRQTQAVRKLFTADNIQSFLSAVLPSDSESLLSLLPVLEAGTTMETDQTADADRGTNNPEVECYCTIVVLMYLFDNKRVSDALSLVTTAMARLTTFNRRTMDVLMSRLASYYSLAHERSGTLSRARPALLSLHRMATLHRDEIGQETLLNLLLRSYVHYGLYDQAEALRAKAQKPDPPRSPQQHARYLFYHGRISAVALDYSEAKDCLSQAARRAPMAATGFRLAATKWLVLVRLLLGEVPERSEMTAPELRASLIPYFDLAAAVRAGDLNAFAQAAAKHDVAYRRDATHNLVTRLRQNVIRTGLRRVNAAYSCISLGDVAARLGLPSAEEAEFVVAKAIRDGGIEGHIDRTVGGLVSGKAVDIYSTDEPANAFHVRTSFCLELHNEAVRAMRFAPKSTQDWEDASKARERREQELQAALDDDDDEMDI